MIIVNFIAYILCIIGGINWGLYGIFDFNLVSWIFQGPRTAGAITLYIIIAVAALWLIISPIITAGVCAFRAATICTKSARTGKFRKCP